MKPITVAAIESDPIYVLEQPDGTQQDVYDLTFTPENWERIRQGYACLRCWEPQRKNAYSLPAADAENHLPGCVYEHDGIRKKQRADIAAEFYGTKWVGPKASLEDTLREDDEKRAKYRRDTGRAAPAAVPSWVKL